MTCFEFVDLVTAYMDGALDEEGRSRFEDHLRLCPGCETYLEQIREVVREVGEVRLEDLSEPARSSLLEAFADWRTDLRRPRKPRRRRAARN